MAGWNDQRCQHGSWGFLAFTNHCIFYEKAPNIWFIVMQNTFYIFASRTFLNWKPRSHDNKIMMANWEITNFYYPSENSREFHGDCDPAAFNSHGFSHPSDFIDRTKTSPKRNRRSFLSHSNKGRWNKIFSQSVYFEFLIISGVIQVVIKFVMVFCEFQGDFFLCACIP